MRYSDSDIDWDAEDIPELTEAFVSQIEYVAEAFGVTVETMREALDCQLAKVGRVQDWDGQQFAMIEYQGCQLLVKIILEPMWTEEPRPTIH